MNISVVIPCFNEEESLSELFAWIAKVMDDNSFSYEVLVIDDGSSDSSWKVIEEEATKNKSIKGIKFRRNFGKAPALHEGFKAAQGDVVITMDADLQDSPDEIPGLYKMIMDEGFDLVSGWKKKRHDPFSKTFPSKIWNGFARMITRIKIHDINCGLKAYKNAVVKSVEVYGEMHRYIPVLAKHAGFKKIGEKVVIHQKRKYGVTKYGVERFAKGFLDLLSISFMSRFGKRPMHIFGTLGSFSFLVGFGIAFWLSYEKLFLFQYKMTERPLFYLGIFAMIIGTQLFLAGFIGEMITRNATERNEYDIEKEI